MNLDRANWTLDQGRDWHVAWYHECLRLIDRFTGQEGRWNANMSADSQLRSRTNLCHYVRCIALWGPGIIFLHLLTASLIMGAVFFMPLKALGVGGYFTMWLVLGAVALLGFGFYKLVLDTERSNAIMDWVERWIGDPTERAVKRTKEKLRFANEDGVSAWSMIWTAIVALKHQICPLIEIKEKE